MSPPPRRRRDEIDEDEEERYRRRRDKERARDDDKRGYDKYASRPSSNSYPSGERSDGQRSRHGDRAREYRHRREREEGSDPEEDGHKRHTLHSSSRSSKRHADEEEMGDVRASERHHRHRSRRETSEERAERKRRRKHKHTDDAEKRAKAAEVLLYSSEATATNPNGDRDTEKFKWAKKAEKERKQGLTPTEARKRDEQQRREAEEEIQQLNIRRAEREREQAIREEEEARMARLAESAAMSEWVAKEDDFYLEQSRRRAVIRVRQNRAKPIDLLAINLKWMNPVADEEASSWKDHPANARATDGPSGDEEEDEADLDVDLEEPYLLFDNLDLEQTEELHQDIQMYLNLESIEQNLDFWRSLIVVCDDKLGELRTLAGEDAAEPGAHPRVDLQTKADVDRMLSTKTHDQLLELQEEVRKKLRSGEAINVEDWESYLKAIVVWRAKAKLRDMHEAIIENRLEHLKRRQRAEEERRRKQGLPSLEEEKAMKAAEAAQRKAELEAQAHDAGDAMAAEMMARESGKEPGDTEDAFNKAEDLTGLEGASQRGSYAWEDKYRPRKPRYFNKVHTGYDWNKYNQTHYDSDNPPPKQVQGYKFNIFYPDLIDKSKPPTYRVIKEKGNDETCLIVFEAGPPYETIGFRIVNKPWNMSRQRGFRAVFERGVLQLYFNFQRMFYRK